ncbi:MAG: hypothetical protein VW236_05015, partial [Flavobacteriaceae bacterium]
MRYSILLIFTLVLAHSNSMMGQEAMRYKFANDSIFSETIELDEVYVLAPLRFEDDAMRIAYLRHQYRIFKVYRYAIM